MENWRNNSVEGTFVFKATVFAARAHAGQFRKCTRIPYLCHPLDVARTLVRLGCDDPVVTAGILHDVLEDTTVTRSELAGEFGEGITGIVEQVTFHDQDDGWRGKKQRTITRLMTVDEQALAVAAADKFCNLSDIAADVAIAGDMVWERFNGGKDGARWYYRELVRLFGKRSTGLRCEPLVGQLQHLVEQLFGEV
ncbi:MAG: bifunctional (p)ppGpp synthetase/guanosine-3',5'-bis(diphosphate) 3'-pyrophosphohydrolase [Chitinispirillaceae bacterium]|nr:bifunctional (p)ppGpp synthetase/guanosine-3',5'-bis(diphosphate) 3'-pyrophosphohydrolase [Chitinispirillaceae bacterium]